MKLHILDSEFRLVELDARRVLVLLDDGVTPIAVASQYLFDAVCVSHFQDPGFNDTLKRLGISNRVVVENLAADTIMPRGLLSPGV
jgi:hypothetical protein